MAIPPCIKSIVPSLKIESDDAVTLSFSDVKKLLPSLEIEGNPDGQLRMSLADLRKLLRVGLASVRVDETWYLAAVPGLREDIQKGKFESVAEHYLLHGYLEGRLPERPNVDEKFYAQEYPDIAAAIKAGRVKSAYDHFIRDGYSEGRKSEPPAGDKIAKPKGKNR